MNWIQALVNDATKKSAKAAAMRTAQALDKHAKMLEKLPKEWTIYDVMKTGNLTYDQAKSVIKTMRVNGLIYPARDIKLYARAKSPGQRRVANRTREEYVAQLKDRWREWAMELPAEFIISQAQDLWDMSYDSTVHRIRRLMSEGLVEHHSRGTYRRMQK